ncbi:hypothetical protein [Caldisericum exile]
MIRIVTDSTAYLTDQQIRDYGNNCSKRDFSNIQDNYHRFRILLSRPSL